MKLGEDKLYTKIIDLGMIYNYVIGKFLIEIV